MSRNAGNNHRVTRPNTALAVQRFKLGRGFWQLPYAKDAARGLARLEPQESSVDRASHPFLPLPFWLGNTFLCPW